MIRPTDIVQVLSATACGFVLVCVVLLEGIYFLVISGASDLPQPPTNPLPPQILNVLWVEAERTCEPEARSIYATSYLLPLIVGPSAMPPGLHVSGRLAHGLFPQCFPDRKHWQFRSAALAMRLTREWTTEQMLTAYGESAFFGRGATGIQAAAERFFGRSADGLGIEALALLAVIPKSPSRYDPWLHPALARQARDRLLGRLRDCGSIGEAEHDTAVASPLGTVTVAPGDQRN